MKLEEIKIRNYRSFDNEGIELKDLGKLNILIGKNNSGKSNVLKFISCLNLFLTENPSNVGYLKANDYNNFEESNEVTCSLKINKKMLEIPKKLSTYFNNANSITIDYKYNSTNRYFLESEDFLRKIIPNYKELTLEQKLEFGILSKTNDEFLKRLTGFIYVKNKDVCLLNSFRKIERNQGIDKNSQDYKVRIYNGFDLINRLNEMKNPRSENQKERLKFIRIENFIKEILNENNLNIEISSDENYLKELSLRINDLQVPLDSLGTGVHQLIIIAATVTVLENYIICIEEPEIFIHPEIQRKFIKYLLKTNNQYFISTHSNTFLNIEGLDVYHILHDGKKSYAKKVISSTEKNILLDDLGYQASDLLQTNYLLWVEGPSDRIYINHWIKGKAPMLVEGIHYSIMFYGGRLLSHLSADNQALNDFINLSKINRNTGIVMDSDKANGKDSLNPTKNRIIEEFKKNKFFIWVTEGREIENYIEEDILKNSIAKLLNSDEFELDYGQYKILTIIKTKGKKQKDLDKINLAKKIIEQKSEWNKFDMDGKISELVKTIKEANQLN